MQFPQGIRNLDLVGLRAAAAVVSFCACFLAAQRAGIVVAAYVDVHVIVCA